jgi:hypothetical protein
MLRLLLALAGIGFLAGCGVKPAPIYRDQASSLEARLSRVHRDDFLNELSLYQGAPYQEAGSSITGVDCSGLVLAVFGSFGVRLPRTVMEQFGHGLPLGRRDVRTGDLVFFGKGDQPTHVGIAVSGREMFHSSSSRGVILEDIDEFSRSLKILGIRRIVRLE